FRDAIRNMDHANSLMRGQKLDYASDLLFWVNPFTEVGTKQMQKALPVARELRLGAEQALAALRTNRKKARAHAETLDAMMFAAARPDALGRRTQYAPGGRPLDAEARALRANT